MMVGEVLKNKEHEREESKPFPPLIPMGYPWREGNGEGKGADFMKDNVRLRMTMMLPGLNTKTPTGSLT
jgi:hypothetical protein